MEWNEYPTYWLNTASQGSDQWHIEHLRRLTASKFGTAIGKKSNVTPLSLAHHIANASFDPTADRTKFSAQHGVVTESKARQWYCYTRKVRVKEVGFAVPKWEPRIGTSVDGEVEGTDGILEIKAPFQVYPPLNEHMNKIKNGWKPQPFYHAHIWETHYAQMQGGMKIMNKSWCDYIVFATESNLAYVERIPFDQQYWDAVLWPGIKNFLDNILDPLLTHE